MTVAPKYALQSGSQITLHGNAHEVLETTVSGYRTVDLQSLGEKFIPFERFSEALKLPGTRIDCVQSTMSPRERLNGYSSFEALSPEQRDVAQFRQACCEAIVTLQDQLAREHQVAEYRLSGRDLDKECFRRPIVSFVRKALDILVNDGDGRGGKTKSFKLYKGRTLREYCDIYEGLGPGDNPLDALTPLDHLKGNKTDRHCDQVYRFMHEAWKDVGLDTKKVSVATVHRRLEDLIRAENEKRIRNELPKLIIPSHATVGDFVHRILTPTQLAVARDGLKHTRNKMGRGSTDLRALFPGEYVEIDECKISLVLSAKARGEWQHLAPKERAKLKKLDEDLRKRYHILVMIDVATRMVLAWVITEQPNAEATLALLRMATRSKQHEANLYDSQLEPLPAMGIGHIKNDNGTGLRNTTVVEAYAGLGITNTVSRAYNSTDRPFIERLFKTVENVFLSSLPGSTGNKPGQLPGYDAIASGVVSTGEFNEHLSKYFLEEYPRTPHFGVGMYGRAPIDVFRELSKTRGLFAPIDPARRRIVLGLKQEVIPDDEGLMLFNALHYNSDQFQRCRDRHGFPRKVSVFLDPDDLNVATVIAEGEKDPIDVYLQETGFGDMTLPQLMEAIAIIRREDPKCTEIHADCVSQIRRDRFDEMRALEKRRDAPKSYFVHEEVTKKANSVMGGARVLRGLTSVSHAVQWAKPGQLLATSDPAVPIFPINDDAEPITLTAAEVSDCMETSPLKGDVEGHKPAPRSRNEAPKAKPLGRPTKVKDLK